MRSDSTWYPISVNLIFRNVYGDLLVGYIVAHVDVQNLSRLMAFGSLDKSEGKTDALSYRAAGNVPSARRHDRQLPPA